MAKPVVLCILDGWGLSDEREANAVALANTPNFNGMMRDCPNTTLSAQGVDVGLPEGQMGNSEVGHTNIGAGRVVWMDLPKIDKAIEDGSFGTNNTLTAFIEKLKKTGGTAHLSGLASPGGVHAHQRHIAHAAHVIADAGVPVLLHLFTDGRDVAPKSAEGQIAELHGALPKGADIASICGRFFAMDRDNRWERVSEAFNLIVSGKGHQTSTAAEAIKLAYNRGETDEFIAPTRTEKWQAPTDKDGLLFLNFRADRAREILSALCDPDFDAFNVSSRPNFAAQCGMVEYSSRHNEFISAIFPSEKIVNTLGEWVASHGLTQFRIAETEKYPHVTFFLNGGREAPYTGEQRYVAPSPKVKTYDMQPEMSAAEVTEHLVDAIRSGGFDLIVVNYANPDMVGHTGDVDAAIKACEAVDKGVGDAIAALNEVGGSMLLTADHGNCEMMIDPETGGPHTAHTLNPVPLVLVGGPADATLEPGRLADLAPSLLALMDLSAPEEMTGKSLVTIP